MEKDAPTITLEQFQDLQRTSDQALLKKVAELARKRDLPSLRNFLTMLETDGFQGSHVLKNNAMSWSLDPNDPKPAWRTADRQSFGHALLTALTPPHVAGVQWTKQAPLSASRNAATEKSQEIFLDRLLDVVSRQEEPVRQQWLNTLLHDASDALGNQLMVTKIIRAGAQQDAFRQTRHPDLHRCSLPIVAEPLIQGNIPASAALADCASLDAVQEMAACIVNGHMTAEAEPRLIFPEAQALAHAAAATDRSYKPWRLLEVMSNRIGTQEMTPVRMQILTQHLHDALTNKVGWSENAVEHLIGDEQSKIRRAMIGAISWEAQAEKGKAPLAEDARPCRDLMEAAVRVHCPQVLALFSEMLKNDAQNQERLSVTDGKQRLPVKTPDAVVTIAPPGAGFNAQRFASTLDVLADHGFSLDVIEGQPSAVFLAEKSPSNMLRKLVVLMDKGVDVHAKNEKGQTAMDLLPDGSKAQWKHVVDSYHVRSKVEEALKQTAVAAPSP